MVIKSTGSATVIHAKSDDFEFPEARNTKKLKWWFLFYSDIYEHLKEMQVYKGRY